MHRINSPTGRFVNKDPDHSIHATKLNAEWFNSVQEEVAAVIESAGIALDDDDDAQLLAAIKILRHYVDDGDSFVVSSPRVDGASSVLRYLGMDVNDGSYNVVSVKSDGINSGFIADKDLGTSEAGSTPVPGVHAQMTLTAQRLSFVRDAEAGSGAVGADEKVSVGFDGILVCNRLATVIKVFINQSGAQFNVPSTFSNSVSFGNNVNFASGKTVTLGGTTQAADVNVSGKMYANRLQVNIVEKTENYNLYSGAAGDNIPNQKGCRVVIVNVGSGSISVTVNSGGAVIGLGQGGAKEFIVINGSGDWAPIG